MKKLLLAAVVLGAATLARPAPADAHFTLAIGLPGFGLFVQEPVPPPVVRARCHRDHGHHHGRYKHHRDWD